MARNPNERGPYIITHATKWSKGSELELKTRLIVLKFINANKPMRYAVRWQTGRGDNGPTFGGASYGSDETAHMVMLKQYLSHNKSYREGNPSHLPGMAK